MRGGYSSGTEDRLYRYSTAPLLESTRRRRRHGGSASSRWLQAVRWLGARTALPLPPRRTLLIRRGNTVRHQQRVTRGGYSSGTEDRLYPLPDRATAGVNAQTTSPGGIRVVALAPSSAVVGRSRTALPLPPAQHTADPPRQRGAP